MNDLEALALEIQEGGPFTFYLHSMSGDRIEETCWPHEQVGPDTYKVSATFRPPAGLWVASCVHGPDGNHINGRREMMALTPGEFVTISAVVPW